MSENQKATQEQDLGEQVRNRREKLMELQQNGQDPFAIVKYDVTHHSMEIKGAYEQLEGTVVVVAGRMMSKRIMGKASFCNLQDLQGTIQSYVARDSIGPVSYTHLLNGKSIIEKYL